MTFEIPKLSGLTTQPAARDLLLKVTPRDRAPSYLFSGPSGAGKTTHALSLVRGLFCENPGDCPGCPSCKKVLNHYHPDLIWVDRTFVVENTKGERKTRAITVDSMQALKAPLHSKPYSAPLRVAVILQADLMNEEAQNVLLKTLEEPSPRAMLILLAERPARLRPTIQSRCRPVRFSPVPQGEVEKALVASHGFDPAVAREAAQWSEGDFREALRHREPEWREFRRKVVGDFDRAATGSAREWMAVASDTEKAGWDFEEEEGEELTDAQNRRRSTEEVLRILMKLWNRRRAGTQPVPEGLRAIPPGDLLTAIQRHLEALEGNLPPRMVLDHLILTMRKGAKTGAVETRSFFDLAIP